MSNGYLSESTYDTLEIYQNDPYQNKRSPTNSSNNNQSSITWKNVPKPSYLPYSQYNNTTSSTNSSNSNNKIEVLDDSVFIEQLQEEDEEKRIQRQRILMMDDQQQLRQDSLLTTITTTTSTIPMIHHHNPCLKSAFTSLSLSEELRKQKEQNETIDWFSFFCLCGCCCFLKNNKQFKTKTIKRQNKKKKKDWRQSKYCTWKWLCLWITLFFFILSSLLLFFCWPRLPLMTLTNIADPYGQETADWGPPDHPFYKTNWQLNITFNNQPNFIPLPIAQMDLTLYIHSSSSSPSPSSSISIPPSSISTNNHYYSNHSFIYPLAYSSLPSITLNKNETKTLSSLFHIDYAAPTSNLSDPIFAQLYNACGPHLINSPPALNMSLQITFHLLHYLWSSTVDVYPTGGSGLICPTD